MRRLLIPRSFLGFVIRVAALNAIVSAGTYATGLLIQGARLAYALQAMQLSRLASAVEQFIPYT